MRGSIWTGVWSIALAGCLLEPVDLADRACPCIEGWVCDTARDRCVPDDPLRDGGPPGDLCNGVDDDGDGRVDEGPDACDARPGGVTLCVEGACELTCAAGRADCNGMAADGCEASLGAATSCGGCGIACAAPTPLCVDEGGAHQCADRCGEERSLCGASCVDVQTSAWHCGGCDQACTVAAGLSTACEAGVCVYACRPGYADCDADPLTCETRIDTLASCGACGRACSTVHTSNACVAGACSVQACDAGWADCNGDGADGCERDLRTPSDCGACGVACGFTGAIASCATGACTLVECHPGLADCDGPANGCETDLSSVTSCGACGNACQAGELCAGSRCTAPTDAVQVAAGDDFTCARIADGRVFCWGADGSGQLGNGSAGASSTAVAVVGVTDAVDLAAGASHACVVRRSGAAACWGEGSRRALGIGGGSPMDQHSPVAVRDLTDALRIAAGRDHTCALRASGAVLCWGANEHGQLGDGTTAERASPTATSVTDAIALGAGDLHTCAVRRDGTALCWGDNRDGALGDGTRVSRSAPDVVSMLGAARMLDGGASFGCAVVAGGALRCWGANASGQLADGTLDARLTPGVVTAPLPALEVASGGAHACARLEGGGVACWGLNASGQVGDGTVLDRRSPRSVTGPLDAVSISAGALHTCAALAGGGVKCWGRGASGRLGTGGTADQHAPASVIGLPGS